MVHKVRFLIFSIIFVFICVLGFTHKVHVETNLLKTLLPEQVVNSADIIDIGNKSASLVKVVFESDSQENIENLSEKFMKNLDTGYFKVNKLDVSKILEKYFSEPANFLSENDRKLLTEKKYDEIYKKSIENLYNPTGIQLTTLDNDPYLLLDNFILSNKKVSKSIDYINGKYYDFTSLSIANALSPNLSNIKIRQLIKLQKKLSDKHSKIYLAGTPIHSYYTSRRSIADINIICILSTLIVIFLTYRFFKNIKLLLPMSLSIIFGMVLGYTANKLWFDSFQIITMVFSTSLIGIGIDYSYHYFFAEKIDKTFITNLSFSLLTTIVPFALLYLTGIELLKQVAVFTIFGLIGIYLVVLFIYPCFSFPKAIITYKPNSMIYKTSIIILCILSVVGFTGLHFNDNLTALYTPTKKLLKAETLYNKISGENNINTQIMTVKGKNLNEIINSEEKITKDLNAKGIKYMALSTFFPSEQKQFENFNLVKNLYKENLNNYYGILSTNQITKLKKKTFIPVKFDYSDIKDFMLNPNTTVIIIYDNNTLNITEKNVHVVNFQSDIMNYMKYYRQLLLILLSVVIIFLYLLLSILYNYKKAFKILIPSGLGIIMSVLLTALIYQELNLFNIIAEFLVLGFTLDYSIFRINPSEKTESAVFVSCVTTSFSFLLLSLCGFKLLSSIAMILFFGISISYLTGYLLIKNHDKIEL